MTTIWEKLATAMVDADDYDPVDTGARLRSDLAKHLENAALRMKSNWPHDAEVIAKMAIRIIQGD